MFSPMRRSILCLADVRFVTADLLRYKARKQAMKGVVLWISPDRRSLAGATNTNEAALIRATRTESTPHIRYFFVAVAGHEMIIDHADRFPKCIDDCRPTKLEAPRAKILGQL